jgi:hypothetical protein
MLSILAAAASESNFGKDIHLPKPPTSSISKKSSSSSTVTRDQKKVKRFERVLKTSPFILYILKKSPTSIEKQLVVLYWEPTTDNNGISTDPMQEAAQETWKISGKCIPVGFERDTESIAFCVAICNKRGVERFEGLSCALVLNQLDVFERVKLHNASESGNLLTLDIARRGSNFIEINEVTIQLDRGSQIVKQVCLARKKGSKHKSPTNEANPSPPLVESEEANLKAPQGVTKPDEMTEE